MPRLAPRLIWYCRQRVSPHAALILPVCRDLESAKNEVRWMREHLLEQQDAGLSTEGASSLSGKKLKNEEQIEIELFRLCKERAKGVPLQYVLGSQPFGELEVRCKKGVLIPRPETETYTIHLARLLHADLIQKTSRKRPIYIIDLCTGTGCIPLLLLHSLYNPPFGTPRRRVASLPDIHIHAMDISPRAVKLARENLILNVKKGILPLPLTETDSEESRLNPVKGLGSGLGLRSEPGLMSGEEKDPKSRKYTFTIHQGNIFSPLSPSMHPPDGQPIDLLVCNPPYISHRGFATQTTRSVRNFEPKLALVPNHPLLETFSSQVQPERASGFASHTQSQPPSFPPQPRVPWTQLYDPTHPSDIFYPLLLSLLTTPLYPRHAFFEVGDLEQALRVASTALSCETLTKELGYEVEIWRDDPSLGSDGTGEWAEMGQEREEYREVDVKREGGRETGKVRVRGVGEGRGVYLRRKADKEV